MVILDLGSNKHAKFLIVDDQMHNIELIERILNRNGYNRMRSTTDSKRFLSLFQEYNPDIIILDLHMPDFDGFELLKALSGIIPPDEYLPILVLTADITSEAKHTALSLGAKDFLNKPLDRSEVLLRIKNLLETRFLHLKLQDQNSNLEQKVAERTENLEKARVEIFECLAKAAEYRDDNSGEHAQRVGELAANLAEKMGLGPDEVDVLRLAAPLHDVGKIGISDTILLKPGSLTEDEFNIMKKHTIIGKEILSKSKTPVFHIAEKIAAYHHESWDGSGYPYGLKGSDIPLEGQIVSVVDVFDALTHQRPYKQAWTVEEAVTEIKRLKGSKFNPELVDKFLQIINDLYL